MNPDEARRSSDLRSDVIPGGGRGTIIVAAADERSVIVSILSALGAPDEEAVIQADMLVEADLRGHPSHGLQRLQVIVERIRNKVTVPGAVVTADWHTPAVVRIDGGRGFGPVVAHRALELISARARETGIALAAVANSNHLGMLAPYVEAIADGGQIAIATTTSEALVHPYGGRRAMIGTNPIAVALPASPHPFVLDMATGEVSMGRILSHLSRGETIPLGWALDEHGSATTDPAAAARGAISPFGGAKGYGLGLAFELLAAVLTQSATGRDVRGTLDVSEPCNKGDVFVCVDPVALRLPDVAAFITPFLEEIRSQSARPGETVNVPGDRSRAFRRRCLVGGAPIATRVWEQARRMQQELLLLS